jgi:hypothetical protein
VLTIGAEPSLVLHGHEHVGQLAHPTTFGPAVARRMSNIPLMDAFVSGSNLLIRSAHLSHRRSRNIRKNHARAAPRNWAIFDPTVQSACGYQTSADFMGEEFEATGCRRGFVISHC